ncbi:MAG: arsenate reductase ArsC [Chloroflexi bacterium]|nr:arsenate reductase ArsC [Chloroflexota bacterium]
MVKPEPKKVLFVCVENAGRSQMAEAFFKHLARGKAAGLSAGTSPAKQVNPAVLQVMREVGIDISQNKPKGLTSELLAEADRVITMGCGAEGVCPAALVPVADWGIEDPKGKPMSKVREIRDRIKAKVEELLRQY